MRFAASVRHPSGKGAVLGGLTALRVNVEMKTWFYLKASEQHAPVLEDELLDMVNECVDSPGTCIEQSFGIRFDYPVVFTRDVFSNENPALLQVLLRKEHKRRHRAVVYIDDGVVTTQPDLRGRIMDYFHEVSDKVELVAPPQVIRGGPAAKTGWEPVREIMWSLGSLHMDRQSFVIAVGGGSVLDMVGFATSIVHRGLRLIRIPTTTLAQDDSGVGVKNGMDEHGQKNFVGTFSPPFAVLIDPSFLRTLHDDHWLGGVAEAVKVAAIKDCRFLAEIHRDGPALGRRDAAGVAAMERVVRRSAELHLEHIRTSGDPFEYGSARPLDFGHWGAHKIETMTHYGIGHGQAVAIGIAVDTYYARETGHIDDDGFWMIIGALTRAGLPIYHPCLQERKEDGTLRILDGLRDFREHLGGILCVTLPSPVGKKTEIHQVDPSLVEQGITYLETLAER